MTKKEREPVSLHNELSGSGVLFKVVRVSEGKAAIEFVDPVAGLMRYVGTDKEIEQALDHLALSLKDLD